MTKAERLIKRIVGKTVGLDTMVFIYHFDQKKPYYPICLDIFKLLEKGQARAVTSVISLAESLSHPRLRSQLVKLQDIRSFFLEEPNLKLVEVGFRVGDTAAFLRRKYQIRLPDALEIATALDSDAALFLTNDSSLQKIEEIPIFILKDFV